MRALLTIVAPILLCVLAGTAVARDSRHLYPVIEALDTPKAKETLGTAVAFYFGNQEHPPAARTLGEHTVNRKTNAANKSDRVACDWVFLTAMLALRDRALQDGGDAVVKITSYYKKTEMASDTEYECHTGAIIAGVALKGTVIKLAK
jgi:hypothetical protein